MNKVLHEYTISCNPCPNLVQKKYIYSTLSVIGLYIRLLECLSGVSCSYLKFSSNLHLRGYPKYM